MKMRKRKIMQTRCKMHWYFESGSWSWIRKWMAKLDLLIKKHRPVGYTGVE